MDAGPGVVRYKAYKHAVSVHTFKFAEYTVTQRRVTMAGRVRTTWLDRELAHCELLLLPKPARPPGTFSGCQSRRRQSCSQPISRVSHSKLCLSSKLKSRVKEAKQSSESSVRPCTPVLMSQRTTVSPRRDNLLRKPTGRTVHSRCLFVGSSGCGSICHRCRGEKARAPVACCWGHGSRRPLRGRAMLSVSAYPLARRNTSGRARKQS